MCGCVAGGVEVTEGGVIGIMLLLLVLVLLSQWEIRL